MRSIKQERSATSSRASRTSATRQTTASAAGSTRKGRSADVLGKTAPWPIAVASEPRPGAAVLPADASPEVRIGPKLKYARLQKGYTLKELALVVGCSESMLSKLENDRLQPSISFLHRLAAALDTSIAELFAEGDPVQDPVRLFPAGRRARFLQNASLGDSGAWFERIIPIAKSGLLQANILNIPPGVASDGYVTHSGEEFGYVIAGVLEITVDGRAYKVGEGDVIFFPSSLPHGYRNAGGSIARVLWVNTPPTL